MPLPDSILNKPILSYGLDFFWRAFWELSTDRDIGMSEGPIPWSSMDRWALRHEIDGDEFNRFVLIMRAMDSAYIEYRTKDQKRKMDRATKKNMKSSGGAIKSKGAR